MKYFFGDTSRTKFQVTGLIRLVLTTYGYVGGISSIIIIALSYFCFIRFFRRYIVSRRRETLLQGIVLFAIGSNWIAGAISFLLVILGGTPLGPITVIYSWSWTPVVIAIAWIYLVFSLIRPQLKIPITTLYGVINLFYLYLMYVRPLEYSTYRLVGGLPDSTVRGIAAGFLIFDLLSTMFLIAPMYLWVGFRSQRPELQVKGKVIGLSVMLFALFTFFEIIIPQSALWLIFARLLILCTIFLMYIGFTLPEWFQRRLPHLAAQIS